MYNGTLTDWADANHFGYWGFSASSLVKSGARVYIIATPLGFLAHDPTTVGHDGYYVFELSEIERGNLTRNAGGYPVVTMRRPIVGPSGGPADFDDHNVTGGIVFSQLDPDGPSIFFEILNSRESLVAE